MNITDNKLYTIKEVAEFMDVSKRTVRRYIEEGFLPAYKLGDRLIKISKDDLNEFLKPLRSDEELRVLGLVDDVISSLD